MNVVVQMAGYYGNQVIPSGNECCSADGWLLQVTKLFPQEMNVVVQMAGYYGNQVIPSGNECCSPDGWLLW